MQLNNHRVHQWLQRCSKRFLTPLVVVSVCIILLLVAEYRMLPVSSQPLRSPSVLPETAIAQQVNLGELFRDLGIDGSIVLYDKKSDRFYEHNPSRNTTAFFPASTFKILNALIALETGVIKDDVTVLTWDGVKREIPAWNRDTNLRQAFKDSAVWFYQVLARKNGHERMQQFVDQARYGNRQIGSPEQIDRFWLDGPLHITPKQEIEFLQRLDRDDLPFSQRTMDLVKDIMIVERTPAYTLRGKTGWITSITPNIGWFVGYLQQNNNTYFFATNITMSTADDATKRLEVTRRSLKALGLL